MNYKDYKDCKYFELRQSINKRELDKYYCWHPKNMESECEYASCPLKKVVKYGNKIEKEEK